MFWDQQVHEGFGKMLNCSSSINLDLCCIAEELLPSVLFVCVSDKVLLDHIENFEVERTGNSGTDGLTGLVIVGQTDWEDWL